MAESVPQEIVTANNYSPLVSVVTWVLLVSMILSVCAKVGMKVLVSRTFNTDDWVLVFAMIVSTGQSIAASIQIVTGVGRHQGSLTASQLDIFQKSGYSSNLLFIASLAISKISILFLLRQITPVTLHRRLALALGAFITIWTLTSLLICAFQCRLPNPWRILGTECIDQISFWISYGVVNIVTEIALIVLPTYTLWNVHIQRKQKIVIIGYFVIRLVVIGAIIAQLTQLNQLRSTRDATFDSWPYYLSTQFVQNLSVITVCIPYIKNFLLGLESGMIQTGNFQLRKVSNPSTPKSGSLPLSEARKQPRLALSARHGGISNQSESQEPNETTRSDLVIHNTHESAVPDSPAGNRSWDGESRSSRANMIKKTTEWKVDYNRQQDMV